MRRASKPAVADQLRRTPIVEVACQKAGVSRMTYYRWRRDDPAFAAEADAALAAGRALVSDLAEGQLVAAIRDRSLPAVTYWLRHHHPDYRAKLEVALPEEALTPEQDALVRRALALAAGGITDANNETDNGREPDSGRHAGRDGEEPRGAAGDHQG